MTAPGTAPDPEADAPRPPAAAAALERIFRAALDLPDDKRADFVARQAAGDQDLRVRVMALLAEDARGTRALLEASPARPAPGREERIGRYRLVRVLGEGGMGTVHLAEQEEPVRRLVALKTIRLGSLSSETKARFAAECQALAEMDHPGIAKIFDGGLTEGGLPYLVMEYTPGLALTDHCDRHRLPLGARLELLARVCDAVQHAHQKGIVHRDLKPGNVLVDERAGRHEPRVIDFGLARALAGPLASGTAPPLVDRLGTPAYMSPARLAGESGVDTRDDVYALGVMLYELVAACHPFGTGTRPERRLAAERDPPAPSTALAALGAELPAASAQRATSPARLQRAVRGELDQIVLRALARDPSRRYPSAQALGDDLRRHLAHEPLTGVRSTPVTRARKFLRRHWLVTGLGGLLVAGLALGLALQRAAWAAGERTRRALEAAAQEAARRHAIERGERAEADLLVRAFKEALLLAQAGESAGESLSVAELLQVLAAHVESLGRSSPGAETALRSALGRAYLVLGLDALALEQYLRAHAIGARELDEDPLDRFEVLEGLIEASRRSGDRHAARGHLAQAQDVARAVFAGRDARFLSALEVLLGVAAGAETDGGAALAALEVVTATLPDVIVRGDESGVTARVLVEAGVQLVKRRAPLASDFLRALEERARTVLAPEDLRLVTFLWTLAQARLQDGAVIDAHAVAATQELVRVAEQRLAHGHWLRSDARRLAGRAYLATGALREAESELLAALAEVRAGRAPAARLELVRRELGELAARLETLPAAELERFLGHSYDLHGRPGTTKAPWWIAVQPGVPPTVLAAAEELLRTRGGPQAEELRAMALARAARFEEALQAFDRLEAEPGPAGRTLRATALAGSGRTAEARLELRALTAQGGQADAELDEWIAELANLLGP
jgi:hypothetical protein